MLGSCLMLSELRRVLSSFLQLTVQPSGFHHDNFYIYLTQPFSGTP